MTVEQRLRLANPVPDEEGLLADGRALDAFVISVKEREGPARGSRSLFRGASMAPTPTSTEGAGPLGVPAGRRPRRAPWLVAAAAAAVTLVLVGATVVVMGLAGDRDAAAPTETDAVAIVVSAYDALNAGDIDRWLDQFSADATIFGSPKPVAGRLYAVLAAAHYRADIVDECRRGAATPTGEAQVECTVTERDDFHAAGGITLTRDELFVVGEDGKIGELGAHVIAFTPPGYFTYNQAFFDWLRKAHPEVHAEIGPEIITHLPSEPEHMRTALWYVAEFLAQSDRYPVTEEP